MTVGVLQDIIEKVRQVSASGNSNQVTDEKIVKYINSYYLYDLPDDLRLLKLQDVYTFNTIQGLDTYPFNYDSWSTVQPPAYCAKREIAFYRNPGEFYSWNFNEQYDEDFATGDGTAGAYSGNTLSFPMIASVNNNAAQDTAIPNTAVFPAGYPPGFNQNNISRIQNILITANTATSSLHVTDDGNGNLIGDCIAGGTINYQTGAIANLTFTAAVPSGNAISIQYKPVTLGRPNTILFFQEQFVLRPVPDKAYTIELVGYREPSQALLGTTSNTSPDLNGRPEYLDWWEMLAFGAAKKLYQDRLDTDGVQLMDAFLQEKISEARTRTYADIGKRQISTIYRDETSQQSYFGWGIK